MRTIINCAILTISVLALGHCQNIYPELSPVLDQPISTDSNVLPLISVHLPGASGLTTGSAGYNSSMNHYMNFTTSSNSYKSSEFTSILSSSIATTSELFSSSLSESYSSGLSSNSTVRPYSDPYISSISTSPDSQWQENSAKGTGSDTIANETGTINSSSTVIELSNSYWSQSSTVLASSSANSPTESFLTSALINSTASEFHITSTPTATTKLSSLSSSILHISSTSSISLLNSSLGFDSSDGAEAPSTWYSSVSPSNSSFVSSVVKNTDTTLSTYQELNFTSPSTISSDLSLPISTSLMLSLNDSSTSAVNITTPSFVLPVNLTSSITDRSSTSGLSAPMASANSSSPSTTLTVDENSSISVYANSTLFLSSESAIDTSPSSSSVSSNLNTTSLHDPATTNGKDRTSSFYLDRSTASSSFNPNTTSRAELSTVDESNNMNTHSSQINSAFMNNSSIYSSSIYSLANSTSISAHEITTTSSILLLNSTSVSDISNTISSSGIFNTLLERNTSIPAVWNTSTLTNSRITTSVPCLTCESSTMNISIPSSNIVNSDSVEPQIEMTTSRYNGANSPTPAWSSETNRNNTSNPSLSSRVTGTASVSLISVETYSTHDTVIGSTVIQHLSTSTRQDSSNTANYSNSTCLTCEITALETTSTAFPNITSEVTFATAAGNTSTVIWNTTGRISSLDTSCPTCTQTMTDKTRPSTSNPQITYTDSAVLNTSVPIDWNTASCSTCTGTPTNASTNFPVLSRSSSTFQNMTSEVAWNMTSCLSCTPETDTIVSPTSASSLSATASESSAINSSTTCITCRSSAYISINSSITGTIAINSTTTPCLTCTSSTPVFVNSSSITGTEIGVVNTSAPCLTCASSLPVSVNSSFTGTEVGTVDISTPCLTCTSSLPAFVNSSSITGTEVGAVNTSTPCLTCTSSLPVFVNSSSITGTEVGAVNTSTPCLTCTSSLPVFVNSSSITRTEVGTANTSTPCITCTSSLPVFVNSSSITGTEVGAVNTSTPCLTCTSSLPALVISSSITATVNTSTPCLTCTTSPPVFVNSSSVTGTDIGVVSTSTPCLTCASSLPVLVNSSSIPGTEVGVVDTSTSSVSIFLNSSSIVGSITVRTSTPCLTCTSSTPFMRNSSAVASTADSNTRCITCKSSAPILPNSSTITRTDPVKTTSPCLTCSLSAPTLRSTSITGTESGAHTSSPPCLSCISSAPSLTNSSSTVESDGGAQYTNGTCQTCIPISTSQNMLSDKTSLASNTASSPVVVTSYVTKTMPCTDPAECSGLSYTVVTSPVTVATQVQTTAPQTTDYITMTVSCTNLTECSGKPTMLTTIAVMPSETQAATGPIDIPFTTLTISCTNPDECSGNSEMVTTIPMSPVISKSSEELYTSYSTLSVPCTVTSLCSGKSYIVTMVPIYGSTPTTEHIVSTLSCTNPKECGGQSVQVTTIRVTRLSTPSPVATPYTSYATMTIPCQESSKCSGKSYVITTVPIYGTQTEPESALHTTATVSCTDTAKCSGQSYMITTIPVSRQTPTGISPEQTDYITSTCTEPSCSVSHGVTTGSHESTALTTLTVSCTNPAECGGQSTYVTTLPVTAVSTISTNAGILYTSYYTRTIPCQHSVSCSGKSYLVTTIPVYGTITPSVNPVRTTSEKVKVTEEIANSIATTIPYTEFLSAEATSSRGQGSTFVTTVTVPCTANGCTTREFVTTVSITLPTPSYPNEPITTLTSSTPIAVEGNTKIITMTITVPCPEETGLTKMSVYQTTLPVVNTKTVIKSGTTLYTTVTVPCTAHDCTTEQFVTTVSIVLPTPSYSNEPVTTVTSSTPIAIQGNTKVITLTVTVPCPSSQTIPGPLTVYQTVNAPDKTISPNSDATDTTDVVVPIITVLCRDGVCETLSVPSTSPTSSRPTALKTTSLKNEFESSTARCSGNGCNTLASELHTTIRVSESITHPSDSYQPSIASFTGQIEPSASQIGPVTVICSGSSCATIVPISTSSTVSELLRTSMPLPVQSNSAPRATIICSEGGICSTILPSSLTTITSAAPTFSSSNVFPAATVPPSQVDSLTVICSEGGICSTVLHTPLPTPPKKPQISSSLVEIGTSNVHTEIPNVSQVNTVICSGSICTTIVPSSPAIATSTSPTSSLATISTSNVRTEIPNVPQINTVICSGSICTTMVPSSLVISTATSPTFSFVAIGTSDVNTEILNVSQVSTVICSGSVCTTIVPSSLVIPISTSSTSSSVVTATTVPPSQVESLTVICSEGGVCSTILHTTIRALSEGPQISSSLVAIGTSNVHSGAPKASQVNTVICSGSICTTIVASSPAIATSATPKASQVSTVICSGSTCTTVVASSLVTATSEALNPSSSGVFSTAAVPPSRAESLTVICSEGSICSTVLHTMLPAQSEASQISSLLVAIGTSYVYSEAPKVSQVNTVICVEGQCTTFSRVPTNVAPVETAPSSSRSLLTVTGATTVPLETSPIPQASPYPTVVCSEGICTTLSLSVPGPRSTASHGETKFVPSASFPLPSTGQTLNTTSESLVSVYKPSPGTVSASSVPILSSRISVSSPVPSPPSDSVPPSPTPVSSEKVGQSSSPATMLQTASSLSITASPPKTIRPSSASSPSLEFIVPNTSPESGRAESIICTAGVCITRPLVDITPTTGAVISTDVPASVSTISPSSASTHSLEAAVSSSSVPGRSHATIHPSSPSLSIIPALSVSSTIQDSKLSFSPTLICSQGTCRTMTIPVSASPVKTVVPSPQLSSVETVSIETVGSSSASILSVGPSSDIGASTVRVTNSGQLSSKGRYPATLSSAPANSSVTISPAQSSRIIEVSQSESVISTTVICKEGICTTMSLTAPVSYPESVSTPSPAPATNTVVSSFSLIPSHSVVGKTTVPVSTPHTGSTSSQASWPTIIVSSQIPTIVEAPQSTIICVEGICTTRLIPPSAANPGSYSPPSAPNPSSSPEIVTLSTSLSPSLSIIAPYSSVDVVTESAGHSLAPTPPTGTETRSPTPALSLEAVSLSTRLFSSAESINLLSSHIASYETAAQSHSLAPSLQPVVSSNDMSPAISSASLPSSSETAVQSHSLALSLQPVVSSNDISPAISSISLPSSSPTLQSVSSTIRATISMTTKATVLCSKEVCSTVASTIPAAPVQSLQSKQSASSLPSEESQESLLPPSFIIPPKTSNHRESQQLSTLSPLPATQKSTSPSSPPVSQRLPVHSESLQPTPSPVSQVPISLSFSLVYTKPKSLPSVLESNHPESPTPSLTSDSTTTWTSTPTETLPITTFITSSCLNDVCMMTTVIQPRSTERMTVCNNEDCKTLPVSNDVIEKSTSSISPTTNVNMEVCSLGKCSTLPLLAPTQALSGKSEKPSAPIIATSTVPAVICSGKMCTTLPAAISPGSTGELTVCSGNDCTTVLATEDSGTAVPVTEKVITLSTILPSTTCTDSIYTIAKTGILLPGRKIPVPQTLEDISDIAVTMVPRTQSRPSQNSQQYSIQIQTDIPIIAPTGVIVPDVQAPGPASPQSSVPVYVPNTSLISAANSLLPISNLAPTAIAEPYHSATYSSEDLLPEFSRSEILPFDLPTPTSSSTTLVSTVPSASSVYPPLVSLPLPSVESRLSEALSLPPTPTESRQTVTTSSNLQQTSSQFIETSCVGSACVQHPGSLASPIPVEVSTCSGPSCVAQAASSIPTSCVGADCQEPPLAVERSCIGESCPSSVQTNSSGRLLAGLAWWKVSIAYIASLLVLFI